MVFLILGLVSLTADMTYEGARSVSGAFLVSLGAAFTGRGDETVEAEVRAGSSSGRAFKRVLNPLSTFISMQDFVSENGDLEGGMEAVAEGVTGR